MYRKSLSDFFMLIFSSFFRWWWATISVVIAIASWLYVPPQGITLPFPLVGIFVFLTTGLLFMTISTIYQGWLLYKERFAGVNVIEFYESDEYGGKYVFLLQSSSNLSPNTLVELKRFVAGVEVSIALVEVMGKNSKGYYQANPIWMSSGHQRDLRMRRFLISDIRADPSVQLKTVQKSIAESGEGGEIYGR